MKRGSPSPVPLLDPAHQTMASREAAAAFDAIAEDFDGRFSEWASVAAQRRAVRRWLTRTFPSDGTLLELGAGTGEDAMYMAAQGFRIVATDPSPRMVNAARQKSAAQGMSERILSEQADAAQLTEHGARWHASGLAPFDGAYSNFAALNCVEDLTPVAQSLAGMLRTNAAVALVLFGPLPPGEIAVQLARGKPGTAFRRVRHAVTARLGGREFSVRYHRPREVARAFAPWFRLERRVGIGVFVPPSAAEPAVSRHPRLLRALEGLDTICERPLALLGDHVLYLFRRIDHSPLGS